MTKLSKVRTPVDGGSHFTVTVPPMDVVLGVRVSCVGVTVILGCPWPAHKRMIDQRHHTGIIKLPLWHKIQTHKRFKRTLIYKTQAHGLHIFGVMPFAKLRKDTDTTVKRLNYLTFILYNLNAVINLAVSLKVQQPNGLLCNFLFKCLWSSDVKY